MNEYVRNTVYKLKVETHTIIIFGTGFIGKGRGYAHLKALEISVDYYCDNNAEKWGKVIVDGIKCISPMELAHLKDAFVFVMMLQDKADEVCKQLKKMGIKDVLTEADILYCDEYIDYIFKPKNDIFCLINEERAPIYTGKGIDNTTGKKIALYTCITGQYEPLLEPEYLEEDLIDYYFLSDREPKHNSVYRYVDVSTIIPSQVEDNIRKNRFCKILGCELFSQYKYSIYIDGKILIAGKLSDYIRKIERTGITVRKEIDPFDCIYIEGAWSLDVFKDPVIIKQMQKYIIEGMPKHLGAFECSCIVRDNQNANIRRIMRDWWNEVYNYSFRDQNSFTYALWKNKVNCEDIDCMEGNLYDDPKLIMVKEHR